MNSRDRIAHCDLRKDLERELERILKTHPGLCDLRERRHREEVEARVTEDKPLEEVTRNLLNTNPSLAHLLRGGKRIRNPFRPQSEEDVDQPFIGKRYPTYFRFRGRKAGEKLKKECQIGKPARIEFETDAENGYFSRDVDQGAFELVAKASVVPLEVEDYSLSLNEGIAILNFSLPTSLKEGELIGFIAEVNDQTQIEPFTNEFSLLLAPQSNKPRGSSIPPKVPGLRLPKVIEVYQDKWRDFGGVA